MALTPTKARDGAAFHVYEGSGSGTEVGITGTVRVLEKREFADIKAAQTGKQILGRRNLARHVYVVVAFKEVDLARLVALFTPNDLVTPYDIKVTPGGDAPETRLRLHPNDVGSSTAQDWVFDRLVPDGDLAWGLDGEGDRVLEAAFLALPEVASLPAIKVGYIGFTP